jgi:Toprim domain
VNTAALDLNAINDLTGAKLGVHDIPCPLCGPARRSPVNRRRKVMRVFRPDLGFATYHCARCGESGYTSDRTAAPPDAATIERTRVEAAEREATARAKRLSKARRLWRKRKPIAGTIAERYLREVRGIPCCLPVTLAYLPPVKPEHSPALIAAYGIPIEPEPGVLSIRNVRAVQLVLLKEDGTKAEVTPNKITVGLASGLPIVLAPMNDLLGLAICEGPENALSVHAATGLGVWASGGASFLPKLVAAVKGLNTPPECITVFIDPDPNGREYGHELAAALADLSALGENQHGSFEVLLKDVAPS